MIVETLFLAILQLYWDANVAVAYVLVSDSKHCCYSAHDPSVTSKFTLCAEILCAVYLMSTNEDCFFALS